MIKEITLAQFKKHKLFKHKIDKKIIIIHGKNGIGKTSILESISLFCQGSGIFNLDLESLIHNNENAFEVKIKTDSEYEIQYISNKKQIKINNSISKASNLLEKIKIHGINPFQSLAFWEDTTFRRKYFDKVFMQHDILYINYYKKYKNALKEKNRLIENQNLNAYWENFLNNEIKTNGLQINSIRNHVLQNLKIKDEVKDFLNADLIIKMNPDFEAQEKILNQPLSLNFQGPHKTQFELNLTNDLIYEEGKKASTGLRKKILIALTLSSLPQTDCDCILLIDDLFSNLDSETIKQTMNLIKTFDFQTWITTLEPIDNEENDENIQYIKLS